MIQTIFSYAILAVIVAGGILLSYELWVFLKDISSQDDKDTKEK